MRTLIRPLLTPLFFLILSFEVGACIDSISYTTEPVQCFGMRNGKIRVTGVFGGAGPYYYSIDGQSFSTNPTFDHLWAGEYTLSVRDGSGCVTQHPMLLTEPFEVVVRLQATDSSIVVGKPITIQALLSPETAKLKSIEWLPLNAFPKQDTLRQRVVLSESTEVTVELIDINGCMARNDLTIQVAEPEIYIPNAIKPGSDDDAYLTVFSGEGVKKVASLRVYNRVGATIFEREDFPPNDPLKGWNGRWKNQPVQPGVYLWLATVELLDGTLEHFEGSVTVVK